MKIHAITIDTADPQKLAAWWAEALRIPVENDYGDIVQLASSPAFPPLQFQYVKDVSEQLNRLHMDIRTSNLEEETCRLSRLGAVVVETFELPQIRYCSLQDPDGNKFDLIQE
ncbi:VOC family protein [Enterobacter cloacae]|uniref:VOC family protein n=1 Tax=Enterobacter cloacae TaxID=550 RepID=UPI0032DA41C7